LLTFSEHGFRFDNKTLFDDFGMIIEGMFDLDLFDNQNANSFDGKDSLFSRKKRNVLFQNIN
jgi:hypothetical protein